MQHANGVVPDFSEIFSKLKSKVMAILKAFEENLASVDPKKISDFKNFPTRILAQVAANLVISHKAGIVQGYLTISNIICSLKSEDSKIDPKIPEIDTKILNFGLASNTGVWPYSQCNELNWSRTAPEILLAFDRKNIELMNAVTHPAADVYALGYVALSVWFDSGEAAEFLQKCLSSGEDCPLLGVLLIYQNMRYGVETLNCVFPPELRYSQTEINFIVSFLESCMNPDPRKRPTSAQSCHEIECFAAGCTDFDEVKILAEQDRPTPKDYFSEKTIEWYEKVTAFYKNFEFRNEDLSVVTSNPIPSALPD
jgi:serine/threonine protein kinase